MGISDILSAILGMFKRPTATTIPPVRNEPPPMPAVPAPRAFALTTEMLADAVDITQARVLPWV
jgi:hypothetical protein